MANLRSECKIGMGTILHQREKKEVLSFRYPIFNFIVCDEDLNSSRILFKRFPFLSVDSKDYLNGSNQPLLPKIKEFLESNLQYIPDSICLQTIPKMFGYVFNPISFWLCFKNNLLDAVLCEVNNTFGDRHYYFTKIDEKNCQPILQKEFHVSPFFPIDGHYQFQFAFTDTHSRIGIQYFTEAHARRLTTFLDLKVFTQSEISPLHLLFKYGWMTPLVVLRIHMLAFKLWIQKVQFYRRPLPPQEEITK